MYHVELKAVHMCLSGFAVPLAQSMYASAVMLCKQAAVQQNMLDFFRIPQKYLSVISYAILGQAACRHEMALRMICATCEYTCMQTATAHQYQC